MRRLTMPALTTALALTMLVGGTATGGAVPDARSDRATGKDGDLARVFSLADRNTPWQLIDKVKLDFPTFHPQGMTVTPDRLFLSSVEILEPTQKHSAPVDGYDRTPGKGVGHLFVMDRQGNLQADIILGEGDMYHPGGIDFDGTNVWVPVAQYRPDSTAIIYRIDARTLDVAKQFEVEDHIGGIVMDRTTGHLVGTTWGSRRFYEWTLEGRQTATWENASYFVDYQDCQYVPSRKMICSGVTNLPQTPAAGGASAGYELGGIALIDLPSQEILHEVPFQQWSTAGHVITRNPVELAADRNRLTLWAAPDDGEEVNGTELLTYQATVPRPPR